MITGFNTDIKHNEKVYHIQTEDKGLQNPYIESLVYVGGEILASKKTSYAELLKQSDFTEKSIGALMETQHKTMIAAIKRGRFDNIETSNRTATSRPTATIPQPEASTEVHRPQPILATTEVEKTLDQVIIDYLASEAESEHLEMTIATPTEFVSGQTVEMKIITRKSLSQQPIHGASIEARVISTVEPPRVLFRGKTEPDGSAVIRCAIPTFRDGTAAMIISAQSALGNDEVKQLVKRKR